VCVCACVYVCVHVCMFVGVCACAHMCVCSYHFHFTTSAPFFSSAKHVGKLFVINDSAKCA